MLNKKILKIFIGMLLGVIIGHPVKIIILVDELNRVPSLMELFTLVWPLNFINAVLGAAAILPLVRDTYKMQSNKEGINTKLIRSYIISCVIYGVLGTYMTIVMIPYSLYGHFSLRYPTDAITFLSFIMALLLSYGIFAWLLWYSIYFFITEVIFEK